MSNPVEFFEIMNQPNNYLLKSEKSNQTNYDIDFLLMSLKKDYYSLTLFNIIIYYSTFSVFF